MVGMDVLARLRLHLVDEGVELADGDVSLAEVEGSLGGVQLGHKAVGNSLVVDVVRHRGVFGEGSNGVIVGAFVVPHGEGRNSQSETEEGNEQNGKHKLLGGHDGESSKRVNRETVGWEDNCFQESSRSAAAEVGQYGAFVRAKWRVPFSRFKFQVGGGVLGGLTEAGAVRYCLALSSNRVILMPDAVHTHAQGFTHTEEDKHDKTHHVEHGHARRLFRGAK